MRVRFHPKHFLWPVQARDYGDRLAASLMQEDRFMVIGSQRAHGVQDIYHVITAQSSIKVSLQRRVHPYV